jgi:RNA polymerase sigma factor (sigma-70 family)
VLTRSAIGPRGRACLLARARTDPHAFADFYEAYADGVFRFVASRVLEAEVALDLTSETFAVALERRLQFRGRSRGEEQAWLYAIARSQLLHFWRDGRVERDALERMTRELPAIRALDETDLERLEQQAGVQAIVSQLGFALRRLPDDQRAAVEMRISADRSYEEIASEQGVSQQLVRARVSRGLRTLASSLNQQGVFAEDVA